MASEDCPPFPRDISLASVSSAYAARDSHFYPREDLYEREGRFAQHMIKLGWYEETDSTWHARVHSLASQVIMEAAHETTVGQVWQDVKRRQPRRARHQNIDAVISAIREGLPLGSVYSKFFTLDELTILGW